MPKVLLITSYGCTPCLRVKRILKEMQSEMPTLTIQEVEYTSSEGSKLSLQNGIQYPPAVFLNGVMIAKGKVDADAMMEQIRKAQGT